jgi:hypothetical protein
MIFIRKMTFRSDTTYGIKVLVYLEIFPVVAHQVTSLFSTSIARVRLSKRVFHAKNRVTCIAKGT